MQKELPSPAQRRGWARWLLGAPVIAVAVFAFAFGMTRPLGGGGPQPSFFVIGSAVPGVQIGQIAPGTARDPASRFALSDLDGRQVDLRGFEGRPLWIVFWKTACEPCEEEAADVAAAYTAHRADGLVVLAVDAWDTPTTVADYVEDHALDYPLAMDTSGSLRDAFGVWGAPTHYFIDAEGIIRDRYFGPMTGDQIDVSLGEIVSP